MAQYSDDHEIAEESYDECVKHIAEENSRRLCPVCLGDGFELSTRDEGPLEVKCSYCLGIGLIS